MAGLTRVKALAWIACLGLLFSGGAACTWSPTPGPGKTSSRGFYYTVKPGDTLYRIGKRYGVPAKVLARANRIHDVTELAVGQRIYIPRRGETVGASKSGRRSARSTGASSDLKRSVREEARRRAKLSFAWPLSRTKLTSRFGRRNGSPHEGIDLSAPKGTTIRAAEGGKVIHSGTLGAYGKVVIVKHAGDYRSVYAHARKLFVRKGQFVEKAQKLAEVGMTGRTTGPHLHFEIRRKEVPKDPLLYLP